MKHLNDSIFEKFMKMFFYDLYFAFTLICMNELESYSKWENISSFLLIFLKVSIVWWHLMYPQQINSIPPKIGQSGLTFAANKTQKRRISRFKLPKHPQGVRIQVWDISRKYFWRQYGNTFLLLLLSKTVSLSSQTTTNCFPKNDNKSICLALE